MFQCPRRAVLLLTLTSGLLFSTGSCLNSDAVVSSLADLTAATAGSLVETLLQTGFTDATNFDPRQPDTSLPISQQQH